MRNTKLLRRRNWISFWRLDKLTFCNLYIYCKANFIFLLVVHYPFLQYLRLIILYVLNISPIPPASFIFPLPKSFPYLTLPFSKRVSPIDVKRATVSGGGSSGTGSPDLLSVIKLLKGHDWKNSFH